MGDCTPAYEYMAMMKQKLARPSERSLQIKIGPSGLGSKCDYCVAETMSFQKFPERYIPEDNNLRTLTGTAWHYWLEHLFEGEEWDDVGHVPEMRKLYVGTIEGYGDIYGTADMYSEHYQTVCDLKTASMQNLQKFKRYGLSQSYEYQTHLYGKGIENAGLPIKYVANFFVPPSGFNLSDIWMVAFPYDPEKAERALIRATLIFNDYVKPDKIDELGSDPDCFTCNRRF